MAFRNPPIAGLYLVRPALQSPNYVLGTTGWSINRDGSSEFNSGTFRGQLTSGTNPGKHVVLNSSTTGDAIDVYNASNQLIFSVNGFGVAKSTNPATGISSSLQNGQITLDDGAGNNDAQMVLSPAANATQQTSAQLLCSPPVGISYALNLIGGSDDGTKKPTLVGNERNIQGSMVQSDQRSTGNLMHVGVYNVTTDGSGAGTFNHGASFTPTAGFLVGGNGIAATFPWQYAWFSTPFTSTTAHAAFRDNTGALLTNTTVGVYGLFFG